MTNSKLKHCQMFDKHYLKILITIFGLATSLTVQINSDSWEDVRGNNDTGFLSFGFTFYLTRQ